MTAVTPAPKKTALTGLEVILSSMTLSWEPDTNIKLSLISFMPYKKSANPPKRVTIPKIPIITLRVSRLLPPDP